MTTRFKDTGAEYCWIIIKKWTHMCTLIVALQNIYSVRSHFIIWLLNLFSFHPCLSVCLSVLQVYRCEVTNHLNAHAGKKTGAAAAAAAACSRKHFISASSASRLSLLSPCRASFSFPPFHLHFLIKTILISFIRAGGGGVTRPGGDGPTWGAVCALNAFQTRAL